MGQAMVDVLSVPNFLFKIGLMIALAALLGGTLLDSWKHLKTALLIIVVFVICQLWIHDTILDTTTLIVVKDHSLVTSINILMSFIIVGLWTGGLSLGLWIVRTTRKPFEIRRAFLEDELAEIARRSSLEDLYNIVKLGKEPTHPLRRSTDPKREEENDRKE